MDSMRNKNKSGSNRGAAIEEFIYAAGEARELGEESTCDDNAYPPGTSTEYKDAKRSGEAKVSEDIEAGKWKDYKPPPLPEK
jgi:hypothetical protein